MADRCFPDDVTRPGNGGTTVFPEREDCRAASR